MCLSGNTFLSGKYELGRKLGTGRSGTVYLAYHKGLEECRAVKVVPKSMADHDTFRREALLLKALRHPGIPLVYDVEEDENNSYLIEEFLEGESLYALVKRAGSLSLDTVLSIGVQVCRILEFMSSGSNPILYLDLQPKNLLVCDGKVRLIDFDHAQYASEIKEAGDRYGTVGFAAPEQYGGGCLDCRTDVYAVGALLYFLSRGQPPGRAPDFGSDGKLWQLDRVIRGCMAEDKEQRYRGAREVREALGELQENISEELANQSQTIVFAGARPGIGTTHAALALASFLARGGHSALYEEEHDSLAVRQLAGNMGLKADAGGMFSIGRLRLRPFYGSSVKLPYVYHTFIIKDAGTLWTRGKRPPKGDFYALVCGGKWWETDSTLKAASYFKELGRLVVLMNFMPERPKIRLPEKMREIPCVNLPFLPNPFSRDTKADVCFGKVIELGTGDRLDSGAGGAGRWEGAGNICQKRRARRGANEKPR